MLDFSSFKENILKMFLCVSMLFASQLYATQGDYVKQGDIVYSYMEGKIQFLSQKTSDGKTVGLLKTLKDNTEVSSINIDTLRGTVSFIMAVKQKNPICASWTDTQPVIIQLNPRLVTEISLDGEEAASAGSVTILTPVK